jgi:hypothetical protein
MANWTKHDLVKQFERAKKNGWIKFFKSAAARYQFAPEILISRETNMRNIIGDGGHGYGIMQIDDRSFPGNPLRSTEHSRLSWASPGERPRAR